MFDILTLNAISPLGLNRFPDNLFSVADDIENPDGILLRSHDLHKTDFPSSLKAIARAGAGVNNIPIEKCSKNGIVVFNTPGANANSVKELVRASLFLSSRKIHEGISWARSLKGRNSGIEQMIEKGKSQFAGPEVRGKKLGVIGLGAIGVLVANDAVGLGMEVVGYDPFISIESAWGLSRSVTRAQRIDNLLSTVDYISLHLPLTEKTASTLDKTAFSKMKIGVRILNFSRAGLVDDPALINAIETGIVERYITDFPNEQLLNNDSVIPIPHLGASTPEAEENCAIMAADQMISFLTTGNIRNSVNFPTCEMPASGDARIVIANENIPNMVGQISTTLAEQKINISDMLNRHKADYAYNIIDIEGTMSPGTIEDLKRIDGVVMVRLIGGE